MSKSKANKEQPVIDLLVEASPQAALLIMKRRKLLRTGGSLYVGQLKRLEGRTWLKASIPIDNISRNAWDLAHETVARYKKDLGQTPYIEPDRKGGEYDTLDKQERAATNAGTPDDGLDAFKGVSFDPNDILRSVMPDLSQFGVPNLHNFNMPGAGMPQPGFGAHSTGRGFGPGMSAGMGPGFGLGSGFGSGLGSRSNPSVPQSPGMHPGAGGGHDSSSEAAKAPTVPALHEVPGWDMLHPVTARMLTVETAQLLPLQMPGVPPQAHPIASLRAIAKLSQCSSVLREFLRRLPDDDDHSADGPDAPVPPLSPLTAREALSFSDFGDSTDLKMPLIVEIAEEVEA